MTNDEKIDRAEPWFDWYMRKLTTESVVDPPRDGVRFRCPCCGFRTLNERGGYDICPVCFWEDDGQDDADANTVCGGPKVAQPDCGA
jgi:hypothetical protein